MERLDPEGLRSFARRDWQRVEWLSRQAHAAQSPEERIRLAISLYEGSRATRPGWPDDTERRADLESHLRMRHLLDRAAHVGTR